MNNYEESRRNFLTKLGLTVGAVATGTAKLTASVKHHKSEFIITPEQQAFMDEYEVWMDNFSKAVVAQRQNQEDLIAKARIMELSKEAETWQLELTEYMKDENFARY